MSRFSRVVVVLAAVSLLVAAAPASAPAADGGPTATASKSCSVGKQNYGVTYVLWIRARNVGCRKARERVRAFHECRPGKRGRCPNLGAWNCRENRGPFGAGGYYSTVKCKKGGKVVKHRYNQWT